jgi:hypothetical protein
MYSLFYIKHNITNYVNIKQHYFKIYSRSGQETFQSSVIYYENYFCRKYQKYMIKSFFLIINFYLFLFLFLLK